MNPNAANRKDVRALEKAQREAERQRQEVLSNLMSTTPGRAYIWDLLTQCNCFATTFTPEPYITAFNEGRRSVGLSILGDIMSACLDSYILAAREANVRSTISERRVSENNDGRDQGSGGIEPERSDDPDFDGSNWIGEGQDPRQPGTVDYN